MEKTFIVRVHVVIQAENPAKARDMVVDTLTTYT